MVLKITCCILAVVSKREILLAVRLGVCSFSQAFTRLPVNPRSSFGSGQQDKRPENLTLM